MADEIELKLALTADEHARLGAALAGELGPGEVLDQDNRFFDSADLRLRRARMNLRLRRENGRVILTGKRPGGGAHAAGVFHHDEVERELDAEPWEALIADPSRIPLPADWAAALAGAALVPLGGFANRRLAWSRGGEHICLDETRFRGPGGERIDHELEVETADSAATVAAWRARLAALGIAWRAQPATKFARFLAIAGG